MSIGVGTVLVREIVHKKHGSLGHVRDIVSKLANGRVEVLDFDRGTVSFNGTRDLFVRLIKDKRWIIDNPPGDRQ